MEKPTFIDISASPDGKRHYIEIEGLDHTKLIAVCEWVKTQPYSSAIVQCGGSYEGSGYCHLTCDILPNRGHEPAARS